MRASTREFILDLTTTALIRFAASASIGVVAGVLGAWLVAPKMDFRMSHFLGGIGMMTFFAGSMAAVTTTLAVGVARRGGVSIALSALCCLLGAASQAWPSSAKGLAAPALLPVTLLVLAAGLLFVCAWQLKPVPTVSTAEPPEPAPNQSNQGALRTWCNWIVHPVVSSETLAHQTAQERQRVLRQLWGVSLALTSLLVLAQNTLSEPLLLQYPILFVPVVVTPVVSVLVSFSMIRLAVAVFRIRLDKHLLLTFHTAFAIVYLPLLQVDGFALQIDGLSVLQGAKRDGLGGLEALRALGGHLMGLATNKSAWMVGSSAIQTLLFVFAMLLTTLYARKVRDHGQVTLLRAIAALTIGSLTGYGVILAFAGLAYLLAYAVVQ